MQKKITFSKFYFCKVKLGTLVVNSKLNKKVTSTFVNITKYLTVKS